MTDGSLVPLPICYSRSHARTNAIHEPERILLIRPSALGDVCRTAPVLAALRRAHPKATIDWLVRDDYQEAVASHPALNEVIPFPRRALGRALKRGDPRSTLSWLRALRKRRYDLVIDAQGLIRSAIFAAASGTRRRVGYADAREFGWLAYTDRVAAPRTLHTVDRMLALVAALGVDAAPDMRLAAPGRDREAVAADPVLNRGEHVVMAPTSIWPGKRWPIDRFAALTEALLKRGVGAVIVVGAPGEDDQCRPLIELAERDDRVVNLIGSTSIGRLLAIIERSGLVVANDSAALHIAVGFDRPLVALFGPTRTSLVGPYQRDQDVIQHVHPGDAINHKDADAGRRLMERITVDEVLAAAIARLG